MSITAEQRNELLTLMRERSTWLRHNRAELREELRLLPRLEGLALLAALVASPPEWLEGMAVDKLLRWPRRIGGKTADRLLAQIEVRDRRELRRLTSRQRNLLSELLRGGTSTAGNEGERS